MSNDDFRIEVKNLTEMQEKNHSITSDSGLAHCNKEQNFIVVNKQRFYRLAAIKFALNASIDIANDCLIESIVDDGSKSANDFFMERENLKKRISELNNERNNLKEQIFDLKLTRAALISAIVLLVISIFCSPIPVMVGDVCLSCWGK